MLQSRYPKAHDRSKSVENSFFLGASHPGPPLSHSLPVPKKQKLWTRHWDRTQSMPRGSPALSTALPSRHVIENIFPHIDTHTDIST